MLKLSEIILRANPKKSKRKGLVTAFIYGEYADGKTSYALHAACEVLGGWWKALDHLFFDPKEALCFIEAHRIRHNRRVPILIMDDVAQHLPRARWWIDDVEYFREWLSVARSDCAAILFTAPNRLALPTGIVDQCFRRIWVRKSPNNPDESWARCYKINVSPLWQHNPSVEFDDYFPTHYPDDIYREYEAMRQAMVAPLRRHLIMAMGEDKAIEYLRGMNMTQAEIGEILNKTQQAISYRLNKRHKKSTS